MTYVVLISLISPLDRPLSHAWFTVIAHSLGEDGLQARLLRVCEGYLVIGEVDRLQLAFDDVVGERRPGDHAWFAVHGVERIAFSLAIEACLFDDLIAFGVPACVNGLGRFVSHDLVGRERRRISR